MVLHLVDVALLIWLTPRILRGHSGPQRARITLTPYLVIATYFSLHSASKGGIFLWAVIPTDILQESSHTRSEFLGSLLVDCTGGIPIAPIQQIFDSTRVFL